MDQSRLTQGELLHLAIEATRRNEHGAAISYLKEGVERFPDDGKLAYILGAEFAQIGLYEQAEAEMARAIQLAPNLFTAIFQLGLLQLTLGKANEAEATWVKLDDLPVDNPLYVFKSGLLNFARGHYVEAKMQIEEGLSLNTFSPELNADMERVLAAIPTGAEESEQATHENRDGWLSAYNQDNSN